MLRRAAILLTATGVVVLASNLAGAGRPSAPSPDAAGVNAATDAVHVPMTHAVSLPDPGGIAPAEAGTLAIVGSGTDPDGRLPLADRLAFWAARVERDPGDHLSMVQLAVLEAEEARRTSDVERLMRADALLDRSLGIDASSFAALRAKAGVRFALHDFAGAAAIADRILSIAPDDMGALAIEADARLETGDLEHAAAVFERLATLAPGPAVDVRRARVAYLRGEEADALRLASAANDAARGLVRVDDPAFYHYQLAELARLTGEADLARRELKAGLALAPDDLRLLLASARLDAATGRPEDAIRDLRRATSIVPSPESLALLGDLLALRGDDADAQAAFGTVAAIEQLADATRGVFDRQLALFDLDHGRADPALVARLRDSLAARQDAYGHDLLAWALHRTGQSDAAASEADAALANGIRDARILYHAGVIALTQGRVDVGRARLAEALARSTALAPSEIADATALLERRP